MFQVCFEAVNNFVIREVSIVGVKFYGQALLRIGPEIFGEVMNAVTRTTRTPL